MHKRNIFYNCLGHLAKDEITIIIGARQVGKTTVLKQIESHLKEKGLPVYFINLENLDYLNLLNEHPENIFNLFTLPENQRIYFLLDEIQYLANPTNLMKYLYDEHKNQIKLIVSGSSAFYMDTKFKDSLAGRKKIFNLYTLSLDEFLRFKNKPELSEHTAKIPFDNLTIRNIPFSLQREISNLIDQYLIYGGYPKIVLASTIEEKQELLQDLIFSYVKKDILESGIRNKQKAFEILKLLSSQVGGLLNNNSIAKIMKLSVTAIDNYIFALKKSFHIRAINPFFQNISKEIRKMPKVYFLDLGLRNALIRNFDNSNFRPDMGALYENFVFRQFLDRLPIEAIQFWRTQQKNEVDFIIENRFAYEVKHNLRSFNFSRYKKFIGEYPDIRFNLIFRIGDAEKISGVNFLKF